MISREIRFPKLDRTKIHNIVANLSHEDSVLVLDKSSELNVIDVLEDRFPELICELEKIIGRNMSYEIATGSAMWDITQDLIASNLNSEDEAIAYILYYAPSATEEQRVFLRMKWDFL